MALPNKWREEHDQIRSACGFPTLVEIVKKVKAHSPMAASLPLRMQELLGLHWEVATRNGVDPGDYHFVWDLTNSAKFGCAKDPRLAGIVPCALCGHCLWNTALGRPLSGAELMRVHGFCLKPAAAQLENKILSKLAGDTISVPPIGCILALALANTAPPHDIVRVAETQVEHHVTPCWIGPSAWRGYSRTNDNLMELAGLSVKKAGRSSKAKRLANAKRRPGKTHDIGGDVIYQKKRVSIIRFLSCLSFRPSAHPGWTGPDRMTPCQRIRAIPLSLPL